MAIGLTTPEPAADRMDGLAELPGDISAADLPLFRFGLRQLLLFVAVLCALLSAVASTSGPAALVLIVATGIVTMHILATTLGTRLQARMEKERWRVNQYQSNASIERNSEQTAKLQAIRSAPRSPWHSRGCTYLPWLPRLVAGAMALGGLAGSLLLGGTIGHRTSPEGIIVGAVSFAVLAGWISFVCGNFYGVFRHGFREALAEQQKDQIPQSPSR